MVVRTAELAEFIAQNFAETTTAEMAAAWNDIRIHFVSEFSAQITVKGRIGPVQNYTELGFENRKTSKPALAWVMLGLLAEKGGVIVSRFKTGRQ